jgi:membrane fusion protein, multidrug efflux system
MKRLIFLALVLAVAGGGFAAVRGLAPRTQARTEAAGPPAEPVLAAVVVAKPMPVQIATIGRVQTIANVAVRARIDGVISAVAASDGQNVKAGDVLFTLDDRQLQAQLREAEANLARDQAMLQNARREVDRVRPLVSKNVASHQQVDQLASNVAQAEATVAADEAHVEAGRVQLSYSIIRAPIDGRIGTIISKLGNSVRANDLIPLVTINQIKPIYAAFSLPQRHLAELQDAMAAGPLKVTAAIPGSDRPPHEGQVSFIENTVDPATNTVSVKASFPNADERLWPGQFVNVVVTLRLDPATIVVPSEAVQEGQNGSFVFVIRPDLTVEMRPVTVDRALGGEIAIESGLSAGERVVTQGQLRLEPGSPVQIKDAVTPAAGAEPQS